MKGGHVQVELITSNLWLVSSRFFHCLSVFPVVMYCEIDWYVSQPQLALAFQLAQLHTLKIGIFMSHNGAVGSVFFIVARLLSHMVRTYTKQFI